jgi:hypothetical protein
MRMGRHRLVTVCGMSEVLQHASRQQALRRILYGHEAENGVALGKGITCLLTLAPISSMVREKAGQPVRISRAPIHRFCEAQFK